MSYAKRAIKGTTTVFIISIIAAFIGYIIRMVLSRNLTPAEYGLFFSVFTLIHFIAIFKDLGLSSALVKFIPEFQVKKTLGRIKNGIVIVLGFNLISSIVIAMIIFFTSNILAEHYFKDSLAIPVLGLFAIILIVSSFKDTLRNLFNAFQRMLPFSLMYLLENSFILIFIMVFFYFKLSILSPVFAYLASFILLFFVFLPFFLKIYPYFKFKFKFSPQLTKKMFKFGIPLTLAGIGSTVILYTDTLILTYFRPLQEVGIYNVVVPTAMLLDFFNKSVSQVMFPMISELWAKNLKAYVASAVILLQKYSFVLVVPAALIMFSFPGLLLRLLFGEAYASGTLALQLLVIGLVFFVVAGINMTVFAGIGKPEISTKIILIGALVNFLTNFYFIPKYGMIGAAITSLASYFLILVLSAFYLTKFIKIIIPWLSWIKIFFSGAVFVLVIYLFKVLLQMNPYLEAVISIIIAGAVYIGLIFLFKVADLAEIRSLLKRGND